MDEKTVNYIYRNYNWLFPKEAKEVLDIYYKICSWKNLTEKYNDELKISLLSKFELKNDDLIKFEKFNKGVYLQSIVKRILDDPESKKLIEFNICPFCGDLARTISAKQCRKGHRW